MMCFKISVIGLPPKRGYVIENTIAVPKPLKRSIFGTRMVKNLKKCVWSISSPYPVPDDDPPFLARLPRLPSDYPR
jgi:hypothetical protein